MSDKYIKNQNPSLIDEINITNSVYNSMVENGLKDFSILSVDFIFTSDSKKDLEKLNNKLSKEFQFSIYHLKSLSIFKKEYEFSIEIKDLVITDDTLSFLIGYLFSVALDNFSCLGDWGAEVTDKQYNIQSKELLDFVKNGKKEYKLSNFYRSFENFYFGSLLTESHEIEYYLGSLYYNYGFIGSSIDHYSKAISILPDDPSPYLNRGVAYYDMEKYNDAIQDYKFVINKDPQNPNPYLNSGNAYYQLGNNKLAIDFYKKAIDLGSDIAKKAMERINN